MTMKWECSDNKRAAMVVLGVMLSVSLIPCQAKEVGETTMQQDNAKQSTSLQAEALFAATQCGSAGSQVPTVEQITEQSELDRLFQQLHSHFIGTNTVPAPRGDFSKSVFVFLSMGQKTTGGYAVRLADKKVNLQNHKATIPIHWISPAPGSFVTQALTNPCLLIKLPRADYRQVEFVDQSDKARGTVSLSR